MVEKILVVDDAEDIRGLLKELLQAAGYQTFEATGGTEAIHVIERESLDLVFLDIAMPDISGFQVLRQLRKTSEIPVIMLSARTDTIDKVESFELGADDYITKPFKLAEVIARVKAVLRRGEIRTPMAGKVDFNDGRLLINLNKRCVTVEGKELKLTPKEYELLRELVINAGKVLEYPHLLRNVWGSEYVNARELVQSVFRRLRLKIESDPKNPQYLLTVNGVGYRFKEIP